MSATNLIFSAPVSVGAVTQGAYSMTPLVLATHAAADTFTWYLGGTPTSTLSGISMVVENVSGVVVAVVSLTPNADGVSAVYTATGSESWLTNPGVTYNAYVTAIQAADPSGPSGSGILLNSRKLPFTTV
jgi:hypothetical protein